MCQFYNLKLLKTFIRREQSQPNILTQKIFFYCQEHEQLNRIQNTMYAHHTSTPPYHTIPYEIVTGMQVTKIFIFFVMT